MKNGNGNFGGGVTCAEGYLLSLWMHECRRVFCDKLVSDADKNWVDDVITELAQSNVDAKLASEVHAL